MPECNVFCRGNQYSYIEWYLIAEIVLNHSCKADLSHQYLVEKQKAGEKAVEFVRLLDYEKAHHSSLGGGQEGV